MNEYRTIIIITNQCNLKCAYCVYGCDQNNKAYFITPEDFRNAVIQLKNFNEIKHLTLSGGDPLMHPQFLQLCTIARKVLPNIDINIYTNGLLILKKFTNIDLEYLHSLHISFITSLYPDIKYLDIYKQTFKQFEQLNIPLYTQSSHIYFMKNFFRKIPLLNNQQIYNEKYKKCSNLTYKNYLFIIYKEKIYPCCGEIGYIIDDLIDNSDCYSLKDITSIKEIVEFSQHPHKICETCLSEGTIHEGKDLVLWQRTSNLTEKYYNTTLQEIFVNNYEDYRSLWIDATNHYQCFVDNFFREKFLDGVNPGEYAYCEQKFINGKADIFLPINNFNCRQLKILLNNQVDIEKYNIYIVLLNNNISFLTDYYQEFLQEFNEKLHVTLLRSSNLLYGYREFKLYSYLNKKILINDINNLKNYSYINQAALV